jgi:hypothetical protein
MRHVPEAQPVKLGDVAREREVFAAPKDFDVMVRIRPAKPLVGLVRIVASEFLVVNGLDQLSGLSTMPLLAPYNRWMDPVVSRIPPRDRVQMSLAGYCPFEGRSIIPRQDYSGVPDLRRGTMHINASQDQCSR